MDQSREGGECPSRQRTRNEPNATQHPPSAGQTGGKGPLHLGESRSVIGLEEEGGIMGITGQQSEGADAVWGGGFIQGDGLGTFFDLGRWILSVNTG